MFVAVLVLVLVAGLLLYAASRPAAFRIERSTTIAAPPERIVPLVDDFHRWPAWSPYEKVDPQMSRSYGGPPRGPGATYEWAGNSKAGVGRMEVLGSEPSQVTIKLDFTKPFVAHNIAEFLLVPGRDGTRVTWAMRGTNGFMAKLFGVVVNMDRLVGRDFETGLASLKAVAEGSAP